MPTFYGAIDLAKNELRNAIVQNLGSAPSTPSKGQIYMNSSDNTLYWYDGAQWIAAKAAAGATPAATVTTQAVGDAPVVGVSTNFAREDHKHGREAFGAVAAQITYGLTSANGVAATVTRSDHTHGTPALGTSPSTQAVGDVAAGGSATDAAKTDHRHGWPAYGAVVAETTFGLASANGVASSLPRSDHTHGSPLHDAAAHGGAVLPYGAITAETTFGAASANGAANTTARSDHTHGNPTHDNAAHAAITLNSLAAPTNQVSMNNQLLRSLADPAISTDAATKNYVDNLVQGLDAKASVKAASTANVPIPSTLTVLDGVTLVDGDRILLKNQTAPAENGIYFVTLNPPMTVAGRTNDMNVWAEVPSAYTWVEQGTTQADTGWVCTADAGGTLGTTAITWTQFSGAGQITAGAGMTKTGNTLDVITGDTSLVVNADELHVNTAVIATVASLASYVPTTRQVIAGTGLTGGGALSSDITINVIGGTGMTVAADAIAVDTSVIATNAYVLGNYAQLATTMTAGAGLTGGGTLGANRTFDVVAGDTSLTVAADSVIVNTAVITPTARAINTTAPLTGGGNLTADRTLAISSFAGSTPGAVPTSPGGTTTFLRADGTWAAAVAPGGAFKYAGALAGTASPEVVTHNLNTRDIQLTVLNGATPYTAVEVDWDATTVNTATIRYNPNLGAGYRVVVVG